MGLPWYKRVIENRQVLLLAAIFLAALALRLFLLLSVNNYYWYGGMSSGFHVAGRNLADGKGFVAGERQQAWVDTYQEQHYVVLPVEQIPVFEDDVYRPVVWRVPGYGFLAALSYQVFGAGLPLRMFQVILDSSVPLLLFFIAKRIFTLKVGYLAALIYALWPPFARNSVHALGEAFLPFLLAALLLLVIQGVQTKRWRNFLLGGLVAGTLVYFRSEWLLFSLVLAAGIVIGNRRLLLHAGLLVLVSTSLVVPWVIRNYHHTGSVVIQSNTGTTIWEGLGEYPNPWGAGRGRKRRGAGEGTGGVGVIGPHRGQPALPAAVFRRGRQRPAILHRRGGAETATGAVAQDRLGVCRGPFQ